MGPGRNGALERGVVGARFGRDGRQSGRRPSGNGVLEGSLGRTAHWKGSSRNSEFGDCSELSVVS